MNTTLLLMVSSLKRSLRSRVVISFGSAILVACLLLGFLGGDATKVTLTLNSIFLTVVPLASLLIVALDYYNNREFIELLVAQPISRAAVYWGQWCGITCALIGSSVGAIVVAYVASMNYNLVVLALTSVVMIMCFSALGWRIAIGQSDKARGVGLAMIVWLWCAVLYDVVLTVFLVVLQDYPLEKALLFLLALNPIDSIRVAVLLWSDVSALMGITGAFLREFLGSERGIAAVCIAIAVWTGYPLLRGWILFRKQDF